jgi:dihydrofolate reductase
MIAIAAMSRNRVIGREGQLPWHLPEDLKFFKRVTMGHALVMGRKTFESIGRPLPGRLNIVLSRPGSPWIPPEGVELMRDPDEVPEKLPDGREVFLIGGGTLYERMLPRCAEIYLTLLDREVQGDTFFPPFEELFTRQEVIERGDGFEIARYLRKREGC